MLLAGSPFPLMLRLWTVFFVFTWAISSHKIIISDSHGCVNRKKYGIFTVNKKHNYEKGGETMKKSELPELALKKQTLVAWAQILYKNGWIDHTRLGKMIELIENLEKGKRYVQ
jgi:hypothetical protein